MSDKARRTRRAIAALGLPSIVLQIFDTRRMPPPFASRYSYPSEMLEMTSKEWREYRCPKMIPLWDNGNGEYIVAYCPDSGKEGFFRCELDGSIEQPNRMGWQQVLVRDFLRLWRFRVKPDEVAEIVAAFGFKHWDQLKMELDAMNNNSALGLEPWYQDFVKRVGQG